VYIYQKSSHSKYVHARQMLQTLLSTFSPTPVITTLNHNTQTDLEYSAQIGCDLLQVAFSSFMAVTIVVLLFTWVIPATICTKQYGENVKVETFGQKTTQESHDATLSKCMPPKKREFGLDYRFENVFSDAHSQGNICGKFHWNPSTK